MEMSRMPTISRFESLDDVSLWRSVAEGTAGATGTKFFAQLTRSLSSAMQTFGAWVTEWRPDERRLYSYSMFLDGGFVDDFNYDIDGTPCERVVERSGSLFHIEDNIVELYPHNQVVQQTHAVSFMGLALLDLDGTVLGHLAALDTRPMPADPRLEALFRVFSARAAAELRRLRAEREVREREARLARLVDGVLDAIVDLDRDFLITHANTAAASVFGAAIDELVGTPFLPLLADESAQKVRGLARALDARPVGQRASWVAGGLTGRTLGGQLFPAEGSLSRSQDAHGEAYYTLILRNVNDRIEAERAIEALASEAEYLRAAGGRTTGMIGKSQAFRAMQQKIGEVAATDATVLVTGETGTGKELVADALHELSARSGKRIIKVNCGAIPDNLIESEFFGHEAGAYTGATRTREGRFALADGGTLFLDEVGELPLSLQPKLLRVLQCGEFEPVGSSRTRSVNVRVVAATHRDLLEEVKAGRFREDLYYRLAVFPIHVPPLRDRREDIPLLTRTLLKKISARMDKTMQAPTDFAIERLCRYDWPGNVRELINVLERAIITSRGGVVDLSRALPDLSETAQLVPAASDEAERAPTVLTIDELRALEKRNFERALELCGGTVAGSSGAAAMLGMKPSTFRSRLQALGIK
jgi:PAS domain S-box-containing protein